MISVRLTLLLPFLFAPIHSQAAKIIQMAVNDINGCSLRWRAEKIAPFYCGDFEKTEELQNDKTVVAAKQKCLTFYETALRTMNTICSYHSQTLNFNDWILEEQPKLQSQRQGMVESVDLNTQLNYLTDLHKTKLEEYGQKLKSSYESYRVHINQMNGRAGSDEFHEAQCNPEMVGSRVPGYLRLLLAVTSQGNAEISFGSIFSDVREHLKIMKEIKATSQENLKVSNLREKQLSSGVSGKDMVQDFPEDIDDRKKTGKAESLILGQAKSYVESTLKKLNPKIGATTTRLVGSGMVLAYKYANNEKIDYPETAASLLGIINSPAGNAADFLVALGRTYQQNLQEYEKFVNPQIKANINISSFELMRGWGREKKSEACVKNVIQADACMQTGKTQVYDRGPCSRSPILQNH